MCRALIFFLGINEEFQRAPINNTFYAGKFKRVPAIAPFGFRKTELSWALNGQLITPLTHPLHSKGFYRDPFGVLTETLDIRTPTHAQQGIYKAIATNGGGQVNVTFTLLVAGENFINIIFLSGS